MSPSPSRWREWSDGESSLDVWTFRLGCARNEEVEESTSSDDVESEGSEATAVCGDLAYVARRRVNRGAGMANDGEMTIAKSVLVSCRSSESRTYS